MSSRTLCTIALMIALSLPVGGQLHAAGWEDTLEQMQKSSSYTEADTNGIRDAFTEAQRQGIPADQLLPRLEEGLAKQVPAARILEVLDREIQALTVSEQLIRQVLGTQAENILSAHPALLERTATLHMQGVSSYELTVLLLVFSEQEAEDRWERYRHGTMLHTALLQWDWSGKRAWQSYQLQPDRPSRGQSTGVSWISSYRACDCGYHRIRWCSGSSHRQKRPDP